MRIFHTIPYFLPSRAFGGPIQSTYYLCKELVKRGHEITLFTTNILGPNEIQNEFLEDEVIDGINVKRFRIWAKFMSYYFTPGIIKSSLSEKPDIIHAHGFRNFQSDAAAACSKLKGIPFVLHPRGMAIPEAAIERGSKTGDLIYRAYDFSTMRFTLRQTSKIIATAEYEKDLLERNNFLKGKIEVIPHGVDASTFKKDESMRSEFRERYGIDGDIILYVGRVDKGKNIEALFRSVSSLQDNPSIVIVGEEVPSTQLAIESIKDELIKYAKKLDLNILFTDGLYGQDLISAYSAADIFVNPSISRAENFGLVNLEAAACSLPVIASPVGVASELLKEHEWLIFNTEEEFVNILDKLLGDKTLRKKIGEELRKKVEKGYTWEEVAGKMEKVYSQLIS